jgi:Flp pilus assembly protein TadD
MEDFRTLMQQGSAHLNNGRFAEAETVFRRVLEQYPNYDDAMQLLGITLFRQGNAVDGESLVRSAIRVNPQNIGARNNLAAMLRDLGRLEESSAELQQLYLLVPEDPNVCLNLAMVLNDLGQTREATSFASKAQSHAPTWFMPHMVQGLIAKQLENLDEALVHLTHACELEPNSAECYSNLSALLLERDDEAAAEQAARAALKLEPDRSDAHHNLGIALAKQSESIEAIKHLERAIEIDPRNAKAHCDLAATLCEVGEKEDLERAMELYRKAQSIDPKLALARFAHGLVELTQGDYDSAMDLYLEAQAINPQLAIAKFGISLLQLTRGDYDNGWINYEARKLAKELRPMAHPKFAPDWTGEPLSGKRIFLYSEQGYGDVLQFVRFVPTLINMGANIDLQVQPELISLLRESLWPIEFVTYAEAEHEAYDFQSSLMSLPMALKLKLADLPVQQGYLMANEEKRKIWQSKFEGTRKPRVGLCWAGNPIFKNDFKRSIASEEFSQLCRGVVADFINLQKDWYENELADFNSQGIELLDWTKEFFNFSETAALIENLDLVITVDTVIAHLAGGLGKPVWILVPNIPDWRWLLDRTDNPWYPTARIYRQAEVNNWGSAIDQVNVDLLKYVSSFSA